MLPSVILYNLFRSRLEEALREAEAAPEPMSGDMTLKDAAILSYKIDVKLQKWRTTLLELHRRGALTQASVRRFEMAQAKAYRFKLMIYATFVRQVSFITVPGLALVVSGEDMMRALPTPEPPRPLLASGQIRLLPQGLGAGLLAAIPLAVWIIAALLVLGIVLGVTYILTSKATEIRKYNLQLDAEAQASQARLAAIQQCMAAGGTAESCTRIVSQAVPPPSPPPPPDDSFNPQKWGQYIVWGMVGVAGLTLLPVVIGAFQSLRGLAPAPRRLAANTVTDAEYE